MNSDPILYFQEEDESYMYLQDGEWLDATTLISIEPELMAPIPIYQFPKEKYTSDPVLVHLTNDWILYQSSGDQLQKLAESRSGTGGSLITKVISLVNPYGPQETFNPELFEHLVNMKNQRIPL